MRHSPRQTPSIDSLRGCVDAACELVRAMLSQSRQTWAKPDNSMVTDIDVAVEALLKDRLRAIAPEAGWLGEESPENPERLQRPLVWVVDPIDGTRSLIEGYPDFCVSVALVDRQLGPVIGVVQNPSTKDQFWAARGGGAWRNGQRLRVAKPSRPLRWLVSRSESARGQWRAPPTDGQFTVAGGLAWKMALVAAGDYHGTMTAWPRSEWDAAAGALLVYEAGGKCTDGHLKSLRWNQRNPTFNGIVCAASEVWQEAIELSRWSARQALNPTC